MPHNGRPAFRCRNCGHIEAAEHAGENALPHACSVCGGGVVHNPKAVTLAAELAAPETAPERRAAIAAEFPRVLAAGAGEKRLEPGNWEVLADQPHDRLAALGVDPAKVIRHSGHPADELVSGHHFTASTTEGGGAEDRAG